MTGLTLTRWKLHTQLRQTVLQPRHLASLSACPEIPEMINFSVREQPDIRKNKRTFHPLYPDESPEKKEEDSDESLMNPLWWYTWCEWFCSLGYGEFESSNIFNHKQCHRSTRTGFCRFPLARHFPFRNFLEDYQGGHHSYLVYCCCYLNEFRLFVNNNNIVFYPRQCITTRTSSSWYNGEEEGSTTGYAWPTCDRRSINPNMLQQARISLPVQRNSALLSRSQAPALPAHKSSYWRPNRRTSFANSSH